MQCAEVKQGSEYKIFLKHLLRPFYIDLQMKITPTDCHVSSSTALTPLRESDPALAALLTLRGYLKRRKKKKKSAPIGVLDLNTNTTQVSGVQNGNVTLQCVYIIGF